MSILVKKADKEVKDNIVNIIKKISEKEKNQLINDVDGKADEWIKSQLEDSDFEIENGKVVEMPDIDYYTDRYFDEEIAGDLNNVKTLISSVFGDDYYDELNSANDSDLKELAGYIYDIAYDQVNKTIEDYAKDFSDDIEESEEQY